MEMETQGLLQQGAAWLGVDPLLMAGFSVAAWGWLMYVARTVPTSAFGLLSRRLVLSVEVDNRDDSEAAAGPATKKERAA
jgi:hypothetical protein